MFDFLVWSDRKRVSLVCRRWNGIINSDRYLRQGKLILYNYSKVQFFSGVEVGLLNTQRNIEFHSSAMLDTDELLMTVAEAFPSGDAVAECVDLFLRSDHEQLFSSVILSLPNLHQLKSLSILANEGFKTFTNGLEIKNDNVQKLKLTFYQNTNCRLITPKLTTLNLVIRYPSDITLLNAISHQLKDLTVNFQSKDLVAKLFFCNFEKLQRLHLSIATLQTHPTHLACRLMCIGFNEKLCFALPGVCASTGHIILCCAVCVCVRGIHTHKHTHTQTGCVMAGMFVNRSHKGNE